MFTLGPDVEFGDGPDQVTVRCSPQTYYLDFDYDLDDLDRGDGARRMTYTVTEGEVRTTGGAGPADEYDLIDAACDRARTSQAATMALLAAPTAVLAALAVRSRRIDSGPA